MNHVYFFFLQDVIHFENYLRINLLILWLELAASPMGLWINESRRILSHVISGGIPKPRAGTHVFTFSLDITQLRERESNKTQQTHTAALLAKSGPQRCKMHSGQQVNRGGGGGGIHWGNIKNNHQPLCSGFYTMPATGANNCGYGPAVLW